MIFSEVYGCYYRAVSRILERILSEGALTERQAEKIIRREAFAESALAITAAVRAEEWQVLDRSYCTPVKHSPTMPLTELERRWLKAISLDPRMKLFADGLEGLEDVPPLYESAWFVYFDRSRGGDPFEDAQYRRIFAQVRDCLCAGRGILIEYLSGKSRRSQGIYYPVRLEYSAREDRFRLIAIGRGAYHILNLARIPDCREADIFPERPGAKPLRFCRAEFVVEDERNCLERVMLRFSGYRKQTVRMEDGRYLVKLDYLREEETELVIGLLSFGPFVQALAPASLVREIKSRILLQPDLL